ncbi:hypothetical protein PUR71_06365 [Streptomyces sp. SP17BM10]|uniref:hypothetical protein n=1 Tax=Streptomyces sp. SP17BM10 TaxID=3002530 RepID=UPI002E75F244|nr:hypothetical protein [Streptomyces sp. SP17BM10]MEE1782547.1 hypothetical protein [Streptomyces sp. SP17BM10]
MIITRGQRDERPERRTGGRTIEWTATERRVFGAALAVLAVLLLLAATGHYNARSGGYLVLREWFDRPLLLWTLALPVLMAAVITVPWWMWVRILLAVVVALLFAGTMLLCIVLADSTVGKGSQEAPGRADRRIVEEETGWALDSSRAYYVDAGTGLTTRRWLIVEEGPYGTFDETVRWSGPDRIEVTAGTGTVTIDLAADGRPSRELHL